MCVLCFHYTLLCCSSSSFLCRPPTLFHPLAQNLSNWRQLCWRFHWGREKEWRREITFIPLRNTPQTSSSTCALCFSLPFIHTALNSALPSDLQSPVSKSFAVIGPITLFRRQVSNHLLLYKPTLWGFHPHPKRHWTTPIFSPVSNLVNIIFFTSLCQLQPSLQSH